FPSPTDNPAPAPGQGAHPRPARPARPGPPPAPPPRPPPAARAPPPRGGRGAPAPARRPAAAGRGAGTPPRPSRRPAALRWSARGQAPFSTVHCPSLSPELLESELFGHARGAFTGASASTRGRVGHAEGGSLLLDEIGDFPLALQPKLLRFIEEKVYERVGDPVTRRADVRILAATNHDLPAQVNEGRFRADLYYRLNVLTITLPPLRERPEDILPLATGFLERFARRHARPARRFSAAASAALRGYAWPGNIRELQNVIERACILCPDEELGAEWLALAPQASLPAIPGAPMSLEELERLHIQRVLAETDTLEAAARVLGIDASTLYRKRKAYGLCPTARAAAVACAHRCGWRWWSCCWPARCCRCTPRPGCRNRWRRSAIRSACRSASTGSGVCWATATPTSCATCCWAANCTSRSSTTSCGRWRRRRRSCSRKWATTPCSTPPWPRSTACTRNASSAPST